MTRLLRIAFFSILTLTFSFQSHALDYGKIAIVAGGSALACGVVADALSNDDDKSDNAWRAALLCGGIGAAYGAANDGFSGDPSFHKDTPRLAENNQQFNLLLTADKAGVAYQMKF